MMPSEVHSQSEKDLSSRREGHVRAIAELRRREQRLSFLGIAILLLAFIFVVLASDGRIPVPWWAALAISVTSLALFIRIRERAAERRADREKALQFIQELEQRRQDHFAFGQPDGSVYSDPHHSFAADLDLFGPNSVFFRLNATRTPIGRDQLANWLLSAMDATQSERRRESVLAIEQDLNFWESHDVLLRRFSERGAQHPAKRAI
ncbi:MAG TPA: hypothetical protein PKA37_18520, partial [Planctomycetota bacterium]|nr:hypothetical protein [Planctomycetota bacterium]